VLRQAADVVVGLDDLGLAGLGAGGLDDVRVDGALGQPLDAGACSPRVEDLDEGVADDLALLLRVLDAGEALQERSSASTRITRTPMWRAKVAMT
jgi:hypothetical protein